MTQREKSLFKVSEREYGDRYKDHLLSQYELYVEGIDKISDRRQNANNYFITINTVLISFIGLLFQAKILENIRWIKLLICVVGITICVIFWFLIRSYKQLNSGKFTVIQELEEKLPAALYGFEWHILKEGTDKNVYFPFSHIEMTIPWIFGTIYFILGIAILIY